MQTEKLYAYVAPREAWRSRGDVSSQDRRLARRVHKGQFVGEPFTLPLNDGSIFLSFLRTINDLDRLPRRNMQVLARTEDPVQHAAYGA